MFFYIEHRVLEKTPEPPASEWARRKKRNLLATGSWWVFPTLVVFAVGRGFFLIAQLHTMPLYLLFEFPILRQCLPQIGIAKENCTDAIFTAHLLP